MANFTDIATTNTVLTISSDLTVRSLPWRNSGLWRSSVTWRGGRRTEHTDLVFGIAQTLQDLEGSSSSYDDRVYGLSSNFTDIQAGEQVIPTGQSGSPIGLLLAITNP